MATGLRRVELDDGDDTSRGDLAPGDGRRRPRGRRRGRAALIAVGVVVAVVAALVAGQAVLDGRRDAADAELAARYADVPGVVAPFGPDLHVLWTAAPGTASVVHSGVLHDDVVVGVERTEDGVELVGVAAEDGRRRWAVPRVVDGTDAPPQQPGVTETDGFVVGTQTWCAEGAPGGDVVCGAGLGQHIGLPPRGSVVWVVDPADGTVRSTAPAVDGEHVLVLGDLLVRARGLAAGGSAATTDLPEVWQVVATDAETGASRWTWTSPVTQSTEAFAVWPFESLSAADDLLVVRGRGITWLLSADGEVVASAVQAADEQYERTRDGRLQPSVATVEGDDGLLSQQAPADPAVDDGTLEGVALVLRGTLDGGVLSARAGDAERWRVPEVRMTLAVLDDRVLVRTFDGLALLDGEDGATLWSVETGVDGDAFATDGRTVLVQGGDVLRAYDLATGRPVWERTLDDVGITDEVTSVGVAPGLRRLVVSRASGAETVLG